MVIRRVFLRAYQPDRGAGKDFHKNKGRGKDQKKGKEGTSPQSGLSASETPKEKEKAAPGNQTIGLPSHRTDDSWTPDAGWFCTKAHTARMVATRLNLGKLQHTLTWTLTAHGRLDRDRQSKDS